MPNGTINLRSFVTSYLERSGAVFEDAGYELVEVLLDHELSPVFKGHLMLAFDSEVARENPSAILVTYGSVFLDELARLAADYGRYTIIYGPAPGSKPGGRLEREIHDRVEFVRCRPPKVVHQWLEEHSFRGFDSSCRIPLLREDGGHGGGSGGQPHRSGGARFCRLVEWGGGRRGAAGRPAEGKSPGLDGVVPNCLPGRRKTGQGACCR